MHLWCCFIYWAASRPYQSWIHALVVLFHIAFLCMVLVQIPHKFEFVCSSPPPLLGAFDWKGGAWKQQFYWWIVLAQGFGITLSFHLHCHQVSPRHSRWAYRLRPTTLWTSTSSWTCLAPWEMTWTPSGALVFSYVRNSQLTRFEPMKFLENYMMWFNPLPTI